MDIMQTAGIITTMTMVVVGQIMAVIMEKEEEEETEEEVEEEVMEVEVEGNDCCCVLSSPSIFWHF
jgi:hypothetical protein